MTNYSNIRIKPKSLYITSNAYQVQVVIPFAGVAELLVSEPAVEALVDGAAIETLEDGDLGTAWMILWAGVSIGVTLALLLVTNASDTPKITAIKINKM